MCIRDRRKELSLLKPDVCVEQRSRRIQRLPIDDAGRHRDVEFASEPFELHVLDACLAEESRLRRDVPEQKREELFFFIPKVNTLFVPEELPEVPGRRKPSRSISVRGSTAQPHCLHESIVMVARERDQGGVALHSTTLGCNVVRGVLGELTRRRHDGPRPHPRLIRALRAEDVQLTDAVCFTRHPSIAVSSSRGSGTERGLASSGRARRGSPRSPGRLPTARLGG